MTKIEVTGKCASKLLILIDKKIRNIRMILYVECQICALFYKLYFTMCYILTDYIPWFPSSMLNFGQKSMTSVFVEYVLELAPFFDSLHKDI